MKNNDEIAGFATQTEENFKKSKTIDYNDKNAYINPTNLFIPQRKLKHSKCLSISKKINKITYSRLKNKILKTYTPNAYLSKIEEKNKSLFSSSEILSIFHNFL